MTTADQPRCVACNRGSDLTPIIRFEFRGVTYHICPQHLPLLIHNPIELIGRLPGAETLSPAEHKD